VVARSRSKGVSEMPPEEIKGAVRKAYAKVATAQRCCCNTSCCDEPRMGKSADRAKRYGYDTKGLPKSVTGFFDGCGNPLYLSDIREGETVLDLGSGAGLDVFMAAKRVGAEGRVIGVDMTPEMIEKAKANAQKLGVKNVEFRLGDLEDVPIDDGSVDVVISNCVMNLVPDKQKAFREAYRVLRPGGRMFVSDTVLEGALSKRVRESIKAYTGCVSGAMEEGPYLQTIRDAGFADVKVMGRSKLSRHVASVKINALKPTK